MNKPLSNGLALFLVALSPLVTFSQSQIVYDNLTTAANGGLAYPDAQNPVFGDTVNFTQAGLATSLYLSLWNPGFDGNSGNITAGNTVVNFYDNSVPYSGGAISGTLLGAVSLPWNFAARGGLAVNAYVVNSFDLTTFNINLTRHVLITQQFHQTFGSSTENGVVLFGNPTVGTSPTTLYLKTSIVAEGLYDNPSNPYQIGYRIVIQPISEPSIFNLLGLGLPIFLAGRRKSQMLNLKFPAASSC